MTADEFNAQYGVGSVVRVYDARSNLLGHTRTTTIATGQYPVVELEDFTRYCPLDRIEVVEASTITPLRGCFDISISGAQFEINLPANVRAINRAAAGEIPNIYIEGVSLTDLPDRPEGVRRETWWRLCNSIEHAINEMLDHNGHAPERLEQVVKVL